MTHFGSDCEDSGGGVDVDLHRASSPSGTQCPFAFVVIEVDS